MSAVAELLRASQQQGITAVSGCGRTAMICESQFFRQLLRGQRRAPGWQPSAPVSRGLGHNFVDHHLYRCARLYLYRAYRALEIAALRHGVSGFGYAGADGDFAEIRHDHGR